MTAKELTALQKEDIQMKRTVKAGLNILIPPFMPT